MFNIPTQPGHLRRASPLTRPPITHEKQFIVMGEPLLFQTNTPTLLAIAQQAFGRFPQTTSSIEPPLIMQLFVQADPDINQNQGYPRPVYDSHSHLFYMNIGRVNYAVADLKSGFAFGYMTQQMVQDTQFVRRTFIETLAQAMLSMGRDFVAIHAACVVKDGRSLMFYGQAGVGKSTLAFACLRRGYQILAEDVVQVKIKPSGLHLWGIPWQCHLLADSVRFFPELAEYPLQMQSNGEWKIEVMLEQQYPGSTRTNSPAAILIMLARDSQNQVARIEQLAPEVARARFDVIWPWEVGWKPLYEQQLAQLLAQQTYQLYLGDTPDKSVDALDTFLAREG